MKQKRLVMLGIFLDCGTLKYGVIEGRL